MLGLAALLLFIALALAGYAFAGSVQQREQTAAAVKERLSSATGWRDVDAHGSLLKDQRLSRIDLLNRALASLSITARLSRMVQQAGLSNRVGEIVLYIPLLGLTGVLLGRLLSDSMLVALSGGLFGATLPVFYVRRRRRIRMHLFSEQLPDALDLVRAALQAGHSLVAAFSVVAEEFPDPTAQEFRTVAEEIRLGLPLREALYQLRERVDDANVPILIVGILVAQETGGNMAEVLDNIGYTIRERFKLLRDAEVMTAQGRFSGKVLAALPVFVGLFLFFLNPTYFQPMVETSVGHYLLAYALASVVAGYFAIQRIARIHV